MSNPSLTIVLPVFNGEARLRKSVREILDLASELTPRFGLLIIDDGSTDDTLATAEELASRYPQITVRRHRQQRGLRATLEAVQHRVRSDVVIVHDGVSPLDPNQVRQLWREHAAARTAEGTALQEDVRDLADVKTTHAALVRAHNRLRGFQLFTKQSEAAGEVVEPAPQNGDPRSDVAHERKRAGVGNIPPLPRPKLLSALAEFALSE